VQDHPRDPDDQPRRARPLGFVPGHVLALAQIPPTLVHAPNDALQRLRRAIEVALADLGLKPTTPRPGEDVPVVLPSARGALLSAAVALGSREARAVRVAVERLNSDAGRRAVAAEGLVPLGATPNWFGAAQQDCVGGSPGSDPAPLRHPHGRDLRYVPSSPGLNVADQAAASRWARQPQTHVAILDTAPSWDLAQRAAAYPANHLLGGLLGVLAQPVGSLGGPLEGARQAALAEIQQAGHFYPAHKGRPIEVQDHGLFVASVIHATAPWARLRLVRVLNDYGVGTLELVLIGLAGVAADRPAGDPLVVNLSLGVLPPVEQLPALWNGHPIPGLPGTPADPSLGLADRGPALAHELDVLQRPVERIAAQLLMQNCLLVAAAGNDSLEPDGQPRPERWEPRVPARYDSVLGVAATGHHEQPAPYSNRGDVAPLRDAIATHGGDLEADHVHPRDGVIGVFTAARFPVPDAPNDNGWASWSGTSFATAIASGVAANVWATQLERAPFDAAAILDELNDAVRVGAPPPVAGLRVPPMPIHTAWRP
jgi:hypothetical protein